MAAVKRTSISAGKAIYGILSKSEDVTGKVKNIFPVAVDHTVLPRIVYRRIKGSYVPVKSGVGADASFVEILCCAEDYDSAVDIAEMVRKELDGKYATIGDIRMRSCRYDDGDDFFEDDAYVSRMIFTVAIG